MDSLVSTIPFGTLGNISLAYALTIIFFACIPPVADQECEALWRRTWKVMSESPSAAPRAAEASYRCGSCCRATCLRRSD